MSVQQSSSSQKMKLFHPDGHLKNVQKSDQLKQPCDTVLISKTDNCEVHAHRYILDAFSDYFRELEEPRSNVIELAIDGGTLKTVIDYMYDGVIKLLSDNVDRILTAAKVLKISSLKVAWANFIGEDINITNWFSIASMAEQQQSAELQKTAFDFVLQHFDEVCKSDDFLKLTQDYLCEIISNDNFSADSMETVLDCVMLWVEHDRANREKCKAVLVKHVLDRFLNDETDKEIVGHVSGLCTDDLNFRKFNAKSNTWSCEVLPPAPTQRRLYSAIVIKNKSKHINHLFIAGGMCGDSDSGAVERLDLQTKKWSKLTPMLKKRQIPGVAELNDNLYVIGGYSDTNWLCSVEKYDFDALKWQEVAPMHFPHHDVKVTVLGNLLYAVGIDDGSPIEYYNPANNKWTQLSGKSKISNYYFDIAGVNGHLYAMGGLSEEQTSTTIERYNPTTETWTVIRPGLKIAFHDVQCVSWKNRLIACGEVEAEDRRSLNNKTVVELNPETHEWKTLAPLLLHDKLLHYGSGSLFTFTK